MAEDEELAAIVLAQPQKEPKSKGGKVRVSEYSPEFEVMISVFDRLGEVIKALVAVNGGKPPKIAPHPRPRTAADRIREQMRIEKHKKIVARVMIQQPDGTLRPIGLSAQPTSKARKQTGKTPAILPGEDPFRLRSPRRAPVAPPAPTS